MVLSKQLIWATYDEDQKAVSPGLELGLTISILLRWSNHYCQFIAMVKHYIAFLSDSNLNEVVVP